MSNLFENATTFVDSETVRLVLWGVWLLACVPYSLLSLLGAYTGVVMGLKSPGLLHNWWDWVGLLLLSFAGFAGIVGATIRLTHSVEELATNRRPRLTAKIGLSAGLLVGILSILLILAEPYNEVYYVLVLIPLVFGSLLFAATIGIKPVVEDSA